MRINPDIEETRIYIKLAKEIVSHCHLADIQYASAGHYDLLFVFSNASSTRTAAEMSRDFPAMTSAMIAIDNQLRVFDWPSLALVVDRLRGKSHFNSEVS